MFPQILAFIRALAAYEREPDAVTATEDDLLRDGFGPNPFYFCLIAEHERRSGRLCPLLLQLLHLAGAPGTLSRRPVCPPRVPRPGHRQGAAAARGRHRRRKRLPPPAMGGSRLEHAGHRLLSRHGRRVPRRWRNVRVSGEALLKLAGSLRRRISDAEGARAIRKDSCRDRGPRSRQRRAEGGCPTAGGSRHRRRPRRPGSRAHRGAPRLRCRPLRDARPGRRQAAPHPGPPDHRLRRTGLLQLAQERVAKHRALAAEAGDAPRGLRASCALPTKRPFPRATRWPSIASSSRAASPKPSPPSRTFASFAKKSLRLRRPDQITTAPSSPPARSLLPRSARRSSASPAPTISPSTTPSRPSSMPTPST